MINMKLAVASLCLSLATLCKAESLFDDLPGLGNTPAAGGSVTDFILIDAKTGEDLMLMGDNIPIDISTFGTELTIRAETSSNTKFVRFNLDDSKMIRVEGNAPHYLAGVDPDDGSIYASYSLANLGEHTLEACPVGSGKAWGLDEERRRDLQQNKGGSNNNCLSITFETVDSSSPTYGYGGVELPSSDLPPIEAGIYGKVQGDTMKQYDHITVAFSGPPAGEYSMTIPGTYRAPSTFADYRLDCIFEHSSGAVYIVPGYYTGDADVANNEASSGSVWVCHLTPPLAGTWAYKADFSEGTNVAQYGGGNPAAFFDGATGVFEIGQASADSKGVLGTDLKFSNGEKLTMFGSDSPSNLLAYDDISGTPNNGLYRKSFAPHEVDYNAGDPTFANGKGTGLVGAINYLAEEGVNIISVTTLDLDSADKNVFPFVEPNELLKYDISKLAQWDFILSYAMKKGIVIRLKLEDGASTSYLDEGSLQDTRALYYREMIARFGYHPALIFDIGEDLTASQAKERSEFIRNMDPYGKPIAVRTSSASDLEGYADIPTIDGVVLHIADVETTSSVTSAWLAESDWFVISGEQGSAGVVTDADDSEHDTVRQEALWGNILAGGNGIQYFFGGTSNDESDLTLQDFRSRNNLWDQTRYAKTILETISIDSMESSDISPGNLALVGNDTILVYKKAGPGVPTVSIEGSYSVEWYNPRDGTTGSGSVTSVNAGDSVSLGESPDADDADWVILLKSA